MKKTLSLMCVLCLACSMASAASYTWTGGAGTTDWQTGANWQGGTAPTLGEGAANTINIGNNSTITNGPQLVQYSGNHIFNIGNNSKVTISGNTNANMGNITLGTGSLFTINTNGTLKMRNTTQISQIHGTWNVNGASLQSNDDTGTTTNGAGRKTLDLGLTGLVNVTYSFFCSGFKLEASIDAYGDANSFQSRTLINAGISGGAISNFDNLLFDVKDSNGSLLTNSTYNSLADFLNAGESTIGTYFFEHNSANKDIIVHWYQGAKPIPEPSTATLGLLGLGALILRRRRRA